MTKDATSPFSPGRPVQSDLFFGREVEIRRLDQLARKACAGHLEVAFLSGERGIGKSSLASFVRLVAETQHDMLGLHVFLGGVHTLDEMTRQIFEDLLKRTSRTKWWDQLKGLFGRSVEGVGLFGVNLSFKPPPDELRSLAAQFPQAMRAVMEQVSQDRKGIVLVLDDINGLAADQVFADWLKSFVDEVATSREPLPMLLIIAGLEERRQSLLQLQPSLSRVFEPIDIKAWKREESEQFFAETFQKVDIEVEQDALGRFATFSGGLPFLAHEIGDAAFNRDQDGVIDSADATEAVLVASEIVGNKYLQPRILTAIRSTRYRTILQKLARHPLHFEFKRSEMQDRLSKDEQKVFDNFLQRMRGLGVIQQDPDRGRGAYRFSNLLHYTYFWTEAERAKKNAF